MFKDAAALDRQRTATSFDKALGRYAAHAETWYDGTAGSVDRRLAVCERLLHSARATVARLSSLTDARRYLEAAADLDDDRRALIALRDDLLTGASSREDVVGPPGWRTAIGPVTAPLPEAGVVGRMPNPPAHMNEALKPIYQNAIDTEQDPFEAIKPHLGGLDRRWVDLESARFVAANTDALDDNHELVTRAHEYAARKRPPSPQSAPQRSASALSRGWPPWAVEPIVPRSFAQRPTRTSMTRPFMCAER